MVIPEQTAYKSHRRAVLIKSRREKSVAVRYELTDFKAERGRWGINSRSQTLRLLELWCLQCRREEGRVGLSTCAQATLNPMKVFSFGVDTLDIFSIVPKLADASSPVFFTKGIFTPFAENVTVLRLTFKVRLVIDQVGQVNQAQSLVAWSRWPKS